MATFQQFFQSGQDKNLSAPLQIQQHNGSRWFPIPGWSHTIHVSNELTVIWSCIPLTQRDAHNAEHQVKLMGFNGLPYADVI